jgi:hypothetical protein
MLKTDTPSAVAGNVAAEEAGLADPDDMELLGECIMELSNCLEGDVLMYCVAKMGYKQELRRQYSTVQIFAVAFSIMGLVPSIASTLAFSLPAGPAGMVWVGALIYWYTSTCAASY